MATSLEFTSSSHRLAKTQVRLEDGRTLQADDAGRLDVDLEVGTHQLEVLVDDQWVATRIEIHADDEVVVVDVDDEQSGTEMVGRMLDDRYHIEAAVGQSQTVAIYRGWDRRLERNVAIEMLADGQRVDDEAGRLFVDRARRLAALSHPHLMAVYEVVNLEGRDVMIAEWVEGTSLDERLEREGVLDVDEAVTIAYQLAVAVAYLHEQGMLHRELETADVVVEQGGKIKLIGLGLARSPEYPVEGETDDREVSGYAAPEQLRREESSPETDVYRLGAMLYELSTGRRPGGPDDSMTDDRTELPEEVVELVNACLAEEPEERPEAAEVADRLAPLFGERNGQEAPSKSDSGDSDGDTIRESPGESADGGSSVDANSDEPPRKRRPARPPGGELPGRDPDFTGASGSDDVEWDRPVARVARIVAVVALLFGLAVLGHFLFVASDESDDEAVGDEPPQIERQSDDRSEGQGAVGE